MSEVSLHTAKRRRGVALSSITRLQKHVADLEAKDRLSRKDLVNVKGFIKRLESLDSDFKEHHSTVVDLIEEDEDVLREEQAKLDDHEDKVTDLMSRLVELGIEEEKVPIPSMVESKPFEKRLGFLAKELRSIDERIKDEVVGLEAKSGVDQCLLRQLEKRIDGLMSELADICRGILLLDHGSDERLDQAASLKKVLYALDLELKRLIHHKTTSPKVISGVGTGVKLPKISVPRFDGDIMNWSSFWEQFEVSIHKKEILEDVEKLAYLRDALKDGSAKQVIQGLSRTAGNYAEAIKCLQERYDRPRLIHQAHVRAILEAPPNKDGSAKELRRLHDTLNQHVRALKSMKYDSFDTFITAAAELKFNQSAMREWQKFCRDCESVPPYSALLKFLDLEARGAENTVGDGERRRAVTTPGKKTISRPSYAVNIDETCVGCKKAGHPFNTCKTFQALSHERKMGVVKDNKLCINCLGSGHFVKECPSSQRCKKCHRSHHSWLHIESKSEDRKAAKSGSRSGESTGVVTANVSRTVQHKQVLLMMCKVQLLGPDGSTTQARALLDSASSTSFITERLAQILGLKRKRVDVSITGIGGNSPPLSSRGAVDFRVTSLKSGGRQFAVQALVLRKVTSDLPSSPTPFNDKWKHLSGLELADPEFGTPGAIDLLLGTEIFGQVVLHGRRFGPRGSPTALKTHFGWVLSGAVNGRKHQGSETCCLTTTSADDLLRKFWEIEHPSLQQPILSTEEKMVVRHFEETHTRDGSGRFIVPLPIKEKVDSLGETRSLAVRRFRSLERSLRSSGKFNAFVEAIDEYFEQNHAEPVTPRDMSKPCHEVYYLPMHAVHKTTSTTTQLRVVFDASAKSTTGVSLNDQLLVGPTVHAPLIDVLLRFRQHRVALTTDISRMYRAILLPEAQRDLHRFVWRRDDHSELKDYRMTRLTFGVSASSFAANMAVRKNAIQNERTHPRAAFAVQKSFYVDDGITGACSISEAIELQKELQQLFDKGGFLLRKWKSNEPEALRHLPAHLIEQGTTRELPVANELTKVLGVNWNTESDSLHLTKSIVSSVHPLTKRMLASNIARVYDVLGWYSPTIIKVKILLQQLWVAKIAWDDLVPSAVQSVWEKWKSELPALSQHLIPRCYYPTGVKTASRQLHGFSDASELAYGGEVYVRFSDSDDKIRVALVIAKTKVARIKNLSIPRLELCAAVIVARL